MALPVPTTFHKRTYRTPLIVLRPCSMQMPPPRAQQMNGAMLFDLWSRSDATAPKAASERVALPKGATLDPMLHFPALAKLMPAPWRKVLRLDYVVQHNLRFPEGDFFYEDNVLHWAILTTARRVVLSPHVLVHHRISRSLFGEHEIRNAGFFSVINAIGDELLHRTVSEEHASVVRREFFAFVQRSQWITLRQTLRCATNFRAAFFGSIGSGWRSCRLRASRGCCCRARRARRSPRVHCLEQARPLPPSTLPPSMEASLAAPGPKQMPLPNLLTSALTQLLSCRSTSRW